MAGVGERRGEGGGGGRRRGGGGGGGGHVARVGAAVGELEGEGVVVQALHLLLRGAVVEFLVGAAVVTPVDFEPRPLEFFHFVSYTDMFTPTSLMYI